MLRRPEASSIGKDPCHRVFTGGERDVTALAADSRRPFTRARPRAPFDAADLPRARPPATTTSPSGLVRSLAAASLGPTLLADFCTTHDPWARPANVRPSPEFGWPTAGSRPSRAPDRCRAARDPGFPRRVAPRRAPRSSPSYDGEVRAAQQRATVPVAPTLMGALATAGREVRAKDPRVAGAPPRRASRAPVPRPEGAASPAQRCRGLECSRRVLRRPRASFTRHPAKGAEIRKTAGAFHRTNRRVTHGFPCDPPATRAKSSRGRPPSRCSRERAWLRGGQRLCAHPSVIRVSDHARFGARAQP